MSVKLQKVLGYGLADLAHDDGEIDDPRVNPDSRLLRDPWRIEVDEYKAWLEARDDGQFTRMNMDQFVGRDKRGEHQYKMGDTIVYDGEYGLPNVLVLKPLMQRDWHRSDNTIDYIEETYLRPPGSEPQEPRVQVLEHGIWPFSGMYMDRRTGERLPHIVMNWIQVQSRMREAEATDEKLGLDEADLDLLARAVGFASAAEARENIAPVVPEEITDLAEFGELFTSPDVVLQLRPMLYVFWA